MKTSFFAPVLLVLFLAASLSFSGCSADTASTQALNDHIALYKTIDDTIIMGYLNRHHIPATQYTRTASGLYLINTLDGTGPFIKPGNTFSVRYIGRLLGYANTTTVFDNSYQNRTQCQCASFIAGQQIAGWNEAVQLMQAGTKKTLLIPSYLGYGTTGNGSIPADQPLLFDMEIVSVTP